MYVPAQSHEESVSVPVDFRPPVRAESIDLRTLVSHRTATQSVASMESVSEIFKNGIANFMAVLDGERLLGNVFTTRNSGLARWTLRFFALGA